jgi:hypothetical protein
MGAVEKLSPETLNVWARMAQQNPGAIETGLAAAMTATDVGFDTILGYFGFEGLHDKSILDIAFHDAAGRFPSAAIDYLKKVPVEGATIPSEEEWSEAQNSLKDSLGQVVQKPKQAIRNAMSWFRKQRAQELGVSETFLAKRDEMEADLRRQRDALYAASGPFDRELMDAYDRGDRPGSTLLRWITES